jgi:hypothetical protein
MYLDKWRVSVADAMSKIPASGGERFATVLRHGTLEVEIYAPRGTDPQKPHTRDELYVVEHRFESFTDDLVVWVMFYGPEGGEAGMAGAP